MVAAMSDLLTRVKKLVAEVQCDPYDYVARDIAEGVVVIQAEMWRKDMITGEYGWGQGGEYVVRTSTPDDVIIKICLRASLDYAEHEVREGFKWRGKAVCGPHVSLESIWESMWPSEE